MTSVTEGLWISRGDRILYHLRGIYYEFLTLDGVALSFWCIAQMRAASIWPQFLASRSARPFGNPIRKCRLRYL